MGLLIAGMSLFKSPIWKMKVPEFKIKGKTLPEVFSKEGYQAGGEWYRKAFTTRAEGFATGLFGIGAVEYGKGEEGLFPDWGRPGEYSKVIDTSGKGGGLVNIEIPENVIKIPDIPKITIPPFPEIPKLPEITIPPFPEITIPVSMPSVGGLQMMDDEGKPNLLLMGGLALIAYKVLSGRKK